ncbi:MAG TPA: Rieske 2Fe-2S domain-containing protein [Candidatus Nitrosotalea sp.]|nr:Rieske 2Fe-2S domain-containing protein [Candidatus Nitrosotalea sp.]
MSQSPQQSARRTFLKKAGAVLVGAVTLLVPILSGMVVFLDPLRRKSGNGGFVRVAFLNALPEDGMPRKFSVLADLNDVWNRTPDFPVGAVYLRRLSGNRVEALNVVCPHAGCFVDYVAAKHGYLCPCHNSLFGLNGQIADPNSPSPRGLDQLSVEIRRDTEIWVKFQNYRTGVRGQIPVG